MLKILLFGRDPELLGFLRLTLGFAGYSIITARSRLAARLNLWLCSPELAVVNISSLSSKSLEILRTIRTGSEIPILVVLGRVNPSAVDSALEAGADDYLVAPFRPDELRARTRALAQRGQNWKITLAKENRPMVLSNAALDCRRLRVILDGRDLRLSTPEVMLLYYLMLNRGIVRARSEIIVDVWGDSCTDGDLLLDSTLARLQQRFASSPPQPRYRIEGERVKVVLPLQPESNLSL